MTLRVTSISFLFLEHCKLFVDIFVCFSKTKTPTLMNKCSHVYRDEITTGAILPRSRSSCRYLFICSSRFRYILGQVSHLWHRCTLIKRLHLIQAIDLSGFTLAKKTNQLGLGRSMCSLNARQPFKAFKFVVFKIIIKMFGICIFSPFHHDIQITLTST